MFREVLIRQELMDNMMERSGVDVLDVIRKDRGASFVEARTKCRLCSCAKICREWVLAANGELSPPDFCPNAGIFRTCLKKQS
jgi:hypothetical protein